MRSKWTRLKEDTGVVSIASGQVSKRRGSKGEPRRWVEAVNEVIKSSPVTGFNVAYFTAVWAII